MWLRAQGNRDSARAPPESPKHAARTSRTRLARLMQPEVRDPSWNCSSRADPRPRSMILKGSKPGILRTHGRRTNRMSPHTRRLLWQMRPRYDRHSGFARWLRSRDHHSVCRCPRNPPSSWLGRDCPARDCCNNRLTPSLSLIRWNPANSSMEKEKDMAEVRSWQRQSKD